MFGKLILCLMLSLFLVQISLAQPNVNKNTPNDFLRAGNELVKTETSHVCGDSMSEVRRTFMEISTSVTSVIYSPFLLGRYVYRCVKNSSFEAAQLALCGKDFLILTGSVFLTLVPYVPYAIFMFLRAVVTAISDCIRN